MKNCFYLLPFLLECATGCHSTGMPVSAVKDGSECYCLKTVPTNHLLFPADDSCDVPCPGDQTKMCGGQQAWSFYITCREQNIYYYDQLLANHQFYDTLGFWYSVVGTSRMTMFWLWVSCYVTTVRIKLVS